MRSQLRSFVLVAFCTPLLAHGHHSFLSVYDPGTFVEIEGTVTSVSWGNPHVRFTIEIIGEGGTKSSAEFEGNAKSMLSRMGIPDTPVETGQFVRAAGHPARRQANRFFATNMLLADGRELVLRPEAKPRWNDQTLGTDSTWLNAGTEAKGQSIFRVWSTVLGDRESFPIWNRDYPLTESARRVKAAWNPDAGTILDCNNYGMPTIMASPDPIQFVDRGNLVILQIETFNVERTIHVRGKLEDRSILSSPLGYSVGYWDGDTFVVRTTKVDWPHFDQSGIPLGDKVSIAENFTPSADGRTLEYRITIEDPDTFTEPVVLSKYWVWRPGEALNDYEDDATCVAD